MGAVKSFYHDEINADPSEPFEGVRIVQPEYDKVQTIADLKNTLTHENISPKQASIIRKTIKLLEGI